MGAVWDVTRDSIVYEGKLVRLHNDSGHLLPRISKQDKFSLRFPCNGSNQHSSQQGVMDKVCFLRQGPEQAPALESACAPVAT